MVVDAVPHDLVHEAADSLEAGGPIDLVHPPDISSPQTRHQNAPLCGWTNQGLPEVVPIRGLLSIR